MAVTLAFPDPPPLDLSGRVTTIDTLDAHDPFAARVGTPISTTGISRQQEARPREGCLTATVTNSDASAAELVTTVLTGQLVTVRIAEAAVYSPTTEAAGSVALSPLTPGVADVSAPIPGSITPTYGTRTVTVTGP